MEWKNLNKKMIRFVSSIFIVVFLISCTANKKQVKEINKKDNIKEQKEEKKEKPKDSIEISGKLNFRTLKKEFLIYIDNKEEKKILNDFKEPFLDFTHDYIGKGYYKSIVEILVKINGEIEFSIDSYDNLKNGKEIILTRYDVEKKRTGGAYKLNKEDKLYSLLLKICNLVVLKNK